MYPAELGVTWEEISGAFTKQFVPKLQASAVCMHLACCFWVGGMSEQRQPAVCAQAAGECSLHPHVHLTELAGLKARAQDSQQCVKHLLLLSMPPSSTGGCQGSHQAGIHAGR